MQTGENKIKEFSHTEYRTHLYGPLFRVNTTMASTLSNQINTQNNFFFKEHFQRNSLFIQPKKQKTFPMNSRPSLLAAKINEPSTQRNHFPQNYIRK